MPRTEPDGAAERGEPVGWHTPLRTVIGTRAARQLSEKLELTTVGELLRHYPRKYDRRGKLTDLGGLKVGEPVTVWAKVLAVNDRRMGSTAKVRNVTQVRIGDGQHDLTCTFFNRWNLAGQLPVGTEAMFSGTVSRFNGVLQITSPQVAKLDPGSAAGKDAIDVIESFPGGVIPVYPLTDGITGALMQRCVRTVLEVLDGIPDPVPDVLLAMRRLADLDTAVRDIHRPRTAEDLAAAQARLRYDEALSIQLVLARRRAEAKAFPAEPCPRIPGGLLAAFDDNLPFELTAGQIAVGRTIEQELATIHPMNRLLQGEVGSGKTVVALRAMLQVIDSGRQAVMLAPTEVLAAQHAKSLRDILGPIGAGGELGSLPGAIKITLLTGSLGAGTRREALLDIASGQAGIAVGTHALLSEGVFFAELGLIVVDEQHRFGVEQRNALRSQHPAKSPPHVLVMTATPIPRTVAMTVYGDLDTSILAELPKGRSPIATTVVPVAEKPGWLDRAWQRVREEVGAGHQVFIVCPKIGDQPVGAKSGRGAEESDDGMDLEADDGPGDLTERRPPLAVLEVAESLRDGPLAGLRLGILHGRLPPPEKDAAMAAFAAGHLDVLVATTVIEVGVDVPNATMMVVLDAERFGMSQLHQLRGRVGRGTAAGVCLLVSESPEASVGRARLSAVAATNDGFVLAEADLGLRREGNVLGITQAGKSSGLKQLSLLRDRDVIEHARADALALVGDDPTMTGHPGLAEMVATVIAQQDQVYLEKG